MDLVTGVLIHKIKPSVKSVLVCIVTFERHHVVSDFLSNYQDIDSRVTPEIGSTLADSLKELLSCELPLHSTLGFRGHALGVRHDPSFVPINLQELSVGHTDPRVSTVSPGTSSTSRSVPGQCVSKHSFIPNPNKRVPVVPRRPSTIRD